MYTIKPVTYVVEDSSMGRNPIVVRLVDEGGGEFLIIEGDSNKLGEIRLAFEELQAVVVAVRHLREG